MGFESSSCGEPEQLYTQLLWPGCPTVLGTAGGDSQGATGKRSIQFLVKDQYVESCLGISKTLGVHLFLVAFPGKLLKCQVCLEAMESQGPGGKELGRYTAAR